MFRKISYLTIFFLAFGFGVLGQTLLGPRDTSLQDRSCQVKEVLRNGQVVWTPCDRFRG